MAAHWNFLLACLNRIWSRKIGHSAVQRRARRTNSFDSLRVAAQVESLEQRSLMSAANILSNLQLSTDFTVVQHASPMVSGGFSPSQIRAAYGFSQLSQNGAGQTIAIVDAYDDPTILSDLQHFDAQFGLPDPPSFSVLSQTGTTHLPSTDSTKGWEVEEALDVEWAHALAPGANIVLVEANSASYSDLFAAVTTAANLPGVSVVSMSFGGGEFSGESSFDSIFTTPAGHQGVTFLASTGDNGAPGGFPAYSKNVLAVGGTTLTAPNSTYGSETGWSGSGGGISQFESQPSYQTGVVTQSTTRRTIPDVSFDADPNSGVPVYNSFSNGGNTPWQTVGGTSYSAPAWAAMIALVNQARAQNNLGTLDGATQTLPMLYSLSHSNPSAFHDVTSGNNGHAAGVGYDLVTGLGSPVVNEMVPALAGSPSDNPNPPQGKLVIQHLPSAGTAGTALTTFSVAIQNTSGQVIVSDTSTVTLTLSSGTFSTGAATVTATAVNGVATFSNVTINAAGTYKLTATDSASLTPVTSSSVTISPTKVATLEVQQKPSTGLAGANLDPVIKIAAKDQYGNLVSTSSTVTLTLAQGTFSTGSKTITAPTTGGVATFSSVMFKATGTYSVTASVGTLTGPSFSITINAGVASKLAWQTSPMATTAAGSTLTQFVVAAQDALGNVVTSDHSTVTLTLTGGTFSNGSNTATVTAVHGVATFSGLKINTAGSYKLTASSSNSLPSITSSNFTVTPGDLASLTIQQNPTTGTAGVALAPVIKVAAVDLYGNLISGSPTITLTLTGGTFSTGNATATATTSHGLATFSGLTISTAGSYSIVASVNTLVTSPFTLLVSPAAGKTPDWQTNPPTTAGAGSTLSTFRVAVRDAFGNLASNAGTAVTLKLTGGKFADGTTSVKVTSSDGIATFSNLVINTAGNYTLSATVGTTSTSLANLTITPAAAAKLVFQTAAATKSVAGTAFSGGVVAVEDTYGNVVTTDHSTVTLTLSAGTFNTNSSTILTSAVNGIAHFDNLTINTAGTYTITASDSAQIASVTSANLVISPSTLSSISVQQAPTTGTAGVALAPVIKVAALDQYGNAVLTSNSVTLTLGNGQKFGGGNSTISVSTINGVATFSNLIFKVAGDYTITTSIGAMSGPTLHISVSPAAAAKLVYTTAPATAAVAGSTLNTVTVSVLDTFGNVVTSDQSTIRLTLPNGKFSTGSNTVTATAVHGVASFNQLSFTTGGTYQLVASDTPTVSPVTSSNLVVSAAALSSLVLQSNPTTATAGVAFSPVIKVGAFDQYGNLIMDSKTITLTLSSGTFSTGSSTITATTNHGIATFSGVIINTAGNYTVSISAGQLSGPSFNLAVSPGAGKTPVWQSAPAETAVINTALSAITVQVKDAFGNLATTSTTSITLKLTSGKFSNGMTSVNVVSSAGIATFTNLQFNIAGTYTLTAFIGATGTTSVTVTVSATQSVAPHAAASTAFALFLDDDDEGN